MSALLEYIGVQSLAKILYFQWSYISQKVSLKDFHGLIFTDYQVEYIISLSHYFFSSIKILRSASLQ